MAVSEASEIGGKVETAGDGSKVRKRDNHSLVRLVTTIVDAGFEFP